MKRSGTLLSLGAAIGCVAQSPSTPQAKTGGGVVTAALPAAVPHPSRSEAALAEVVAARNDSWAQGLREDEQHLAEMNGDGAPCTWKARLGPSSGLAFRLARGVAPFAYSATGVFAVRLSPDQPRLFRVMSDNGGFVVQALAETQDIRFHPATPLFLGRFVHLRSSAELFVSRAGAATALLSYELGSGAVGVQPTRVSTEAPCAQASLVDTHFKDDATGEQSSEPAELLASPSVPLSATPGGPTIATLAVAHDRCVAVLERRADQVRVLVAREHDSLVGWIHARRLGEGAECTAVLGHGSGVGSGPRRNLALQTAQCPREVPLGVEQGARRVLVGHIRAQTHFIITDHRSELTHIEAPDSGLSLREAKFYVKTNSLTSCTIRKPPGLGDAGHIY